MNKCTAIISGVPVSLAPYLKYYIDLLNANNLNYILLNVEETNEKVCDNRHQIIFRCPVRPGVIAHIKRMFLGLLFIIKNLWKYRCDRIIVTPTRTGIKLNLLLRLFFNNKYILDIRDFTNEDNKSYKKKEDQLIVASAATFISSRGFMQWISPSDKLRIIHNIPLFYCERSAPHVVEYPIRIGGVGMVSYYKENRALIDALGGDPNFSLSFYGDRTSEWTDVIVNELESKYDNIHFFGHFDNAEKMIIYDKIDVINCLYGNESTNVRTLTPNRLYDAAIFKIPIIVSSGTWVAKCVEKYGIGLSVNVFDDNVAEKIIAYFTEFDKGRFIDNCKCFLETVTAEQYKNSKWIVNFLG